MGPVTGFLTLPFAGPVGVVTWLARQVAEAAMQEMLDPARIEAALLALERRLEAGGIDEQGFEEEEARLLDMLHDMRATRAALEAGEDPFAADAATDAAS